MHHCSITTLYVYGYNKSSKDVDDYGILESLEVCPVCVLSHSTSVHLHSIPQERYLFSIYPIDMYFDCHTFQTFSVQTTLTCH